MYIGNLLFGVTQDNIWEVQILGVSVYHILSWFVIFSFFGWVWETTLVSVRSRKFVNRGFVMGPVCTIYGAGAVSVYLILLPFGGNYGAIFTVGMIVATILEYVTSAAMEKLFHAKWWDYSHHKFNLKGRICLGVSIGWGFMSLALFVLLMPAANWIMSLYSKAAGEIGICLIIVLYMIDFSFASVAAFNLSAKLLEMRISLEELGEKLRTSKAYEFLEDRLDELEEHREILSNSQIRLRLEEAREELIRRQDMLSKRFINSYPMLTRDLLERKAEIDKKKEEIKNKIGKR